MQIIIKSFRWLAFIHLQSHQTWHNTSRFDHSASVWRHRVNGAVSLKKGEKNLNTHICLFKYAH